jgi:hypothetical protein
LFKNCEFVRTKVVKVTENGDRNLENKVLKVTEIGYHSSDTFPALLCADLTDPILVLRFRLPAASCANDMWCFSVRNWGQFDESGLAGIYGKKLNYKNM